MRKLKIDYKESLLNAQKYIAELEKEKCELLGIIQGKDKAIKDLEWQLQEIAKDNDNYQKENAELKEQNRNYEQLIDKGSVTLAKERLKNYKQLTKAKGLLRAWFQYCIDTEGKTPLKIETAQFLKEIEK